MIATIIQIFTYKDVFFEIFSLSDGLFGTSVWVCDEGRLHERKLDYGITVMAEIRLACEEILKERDADIAADIKRRLTGGTP